VSLAGKLKKQGRYETWLARIKTQREAQQARGARLPQAKGIGGQRITRTGRVIPGSIERAYLLNDDQERGRIEEFGRRLTQTLRLAPRGETPRTIPPALKPWRGITDPKTLKFLESDVRRENSRKSLDD